MNDAAAGLQEGEAIFAFFDDVYVVSAPEGTRVLHAALEAALRSHARLGIHLHDGKIRIWNAARSPWASPPCSRLAPAMLSGLAPGLFQRISKGCLYSGRP